MAKQFNLQDKVVTGGRFIPVSTERISSREKLRDISYALGSADNAESNEYIQSIIGDDVITPAEKQTLSVRWRQTREMFARLRDNIREAFGDEELEQLSELSELFYSLSPKFEEIFMDMESNSIVPASFGTMYSQFSEMFSDVSLTYSMNIYEMTKYSIMLEADKSSYSDVDMVEITVELLYESAVVEADYDDYGITWRLKGADIDPNDYKFNEEGRQGIKIPANLFESSITVDCYMNIPTVSS